MDPEVTRHARALLDAHNEVFRAMRAANDALAVASASMDEAISALGAANKAYGNVTKAHEDAIGAALAANRAAIDLLEHLSRNGQ
jgi:hypothetical protein